MAVRQSADAIMAAIPRDEATEKHEELTAARGVERAAPEAPTKHSHRKELVGDPDR